jgi:hypothetical protein
MAQQKTTFRASRSTVGAALIGLGAFILFENVGSAVDGLRMLLGANGSEALGTLPAVVLAASRVLHLCAADHQRFLQILLQHLLLSSWPLLLVRIGTLLSRWPCRESKRSSRKVYQPVDLDRLPFNVQVEVNHLRLKRRHTNAMHGNSQSK